MFLIMETVFLLAVSDVICRDAGYSIISFLVKTSFSNTFMLFYYYKLTFEYRKYLSECDYIGDKMR
jgi:hypothetical protein